MTDATSRLRKLRTRAEKINTTLLMDLKPSFKGQLFRRLPTSDDKGNATTTCSCLMAMALSANPLKAVKYVLFEDNWSTVSDDEARDELTRMFKRVVRGPWTSSGLLDGNAFSSLLILRTAGVLSSTRQKLLDDSPLELCHTFKKFSGQKDVAVPFSLGTTLNLREVLEKFAHNLPIAFSVDKYPPTSAIAYWFVDAVEKLHVPVPKAKWEAIVSWASKNLTRQVSLATSRHDAMKDPIEMAMAACLSQRLKHVISKKRFEFRDEVKQVQPTTIELEEAIIMAFLAQEKSGIWPKYFPLFNYREGGTGSNHLFSFELLEVILDEFGELGLMEHPTVLDGIDRVLEWCESNRLSYRHKNIIYEGWNSGGQLPTLSQGMPESWATAMVHMCLYRLRQALTIRINRHILSKYGANPDNIDKTSDPWDDFIDSPLEIGQKRMSIKKLIQNELLKPVEKKEFLSNNKISGRRSALLFGPPGTSKTTLVRAIAKRIGWPLVELNPSHFLRHGLESIYSQAEEIFEDLNDLSWTVVFFDEMDALATKRDPELDVTRQLLTTSMLPKLSKLHDEARVLFFMATNHQKDFDPAIKRSGRFDLLLCMVPPLFTRKLDRLESFLPKGLSAEDVDFLRGQLRNWISSDRKMVTLLNKFTFDEFKNFLDLIGKREGSYRTSFEVFTREMFIDQLTEWGRSYVSLNQEQNQRETEDDRRASRIQ